MEDKNEGNNSESEVEYSFRITFEKLIHMYPEDIALYWHTSPRKACRELAKEAIEKLWGNSAPVLRTLITGGFELSKAGAKSLDGFFAIPVYSKAKDEWDLLVKHHDTVNYILKTQNLSK